MRLIETPQYQKAFVHYLRYGIPIDLSLKAAAQEHLSSHYIWRTRGDEKVRAAHYANDGKIFAWDNPPDTGHPGEDYGCRCWAEPYKPELEESYFQTVISNVDDASRWGWDDFFDHYFNAGGKAVTLSQIGHLREIIEHAEKNIFPRVRDQVIAKARQIVSGTIKDNFNNSYSFYGVSWAHGGSTVSGEIQGNVHKEQAFLIIEATVDYKFSDIFQDIFSIGLDIGTPYPIKGYWRTRLEVIAHHDKNLSRYK